MATLIRCPSCKFEIDATASKPGSIIKCANCKHDMRIPAGELKPEDVPRGMARQTPLFRKMSNVTAPGARGRPRGGPSDRGASTQPGGYNNGLAIGGAVAGLAALIGIAVLLMKNSGTEAPSAPPKKLMARRTEEAPPPPPPAAGPEAPKPPTSDSSGPPSSWEPDASADVSASVKPVFADPARAQEAILLMKAGNTDQINNSPYSFLPHVINTLISEDKVLAHAAFRALASYCEHANIRDSKDKIPIELEWFNSARYRGYVYQFWAGPGGWWEKKGAGLPDAPTSGGGTNIDKVDWLGLARQLKGGGYHDRTTHQGVAFSKVRAFGKAAYPKLAALLDDEDVSLAADVNNVLNELTGQKMPKVTEANRSAVKALWIDWISRNK